MDEHKWPSFVTSPKIDPTGEYFCGVDQGKCCRWCDCIHFGSVRCPYSPAASKEKPWPKREAGTVGAKPEPPKFYVASRASIPERSEMWRGLRASGVRIVSTWIDEAEEGATQDLSELWARIEGEIRSSDCLILYAESGDFPLKGALVEVGMAISLGKPVHVVARGIMLNPRNLKPLGSWAKHPHVKLFNDVKLAIEAAQSLPSPAPQKGKQMNAQEFYEANATNVMNVSSDPAKSGWAGVRRASEARFIAKDALVMTIQDAWDFAEKYRASSPAQPVGSADLTMEGVLGITGRASKVQE